MFGVWETAGNGTKPFLPSTKRPSDSTQKHNFTHAMHISCTDCFSVSPFRDHDAKCDQVMAPGSITSLFPSPPHRLARLPPQRCLSYCTIGQFLSPGIRMYIEEVSVGKKRLHKFTLGGATYEVIMTWEPEICPLLTMFIKSITSLPSCLEAIQTKRRKQITNGGKTWN